MPVDKIASPVSGLKRGTERWCHGTTWHPRIHMGGSNDPDPVVDCFEVEWDADGKPTLTGNTARMTANQCKATHSLNRAERTCDECDTTKTFYGCDREAVADAWLDDHVCEPREAA